MGIPMYIFPAWDTLENTDYLKQEIRENPKMSELFFFGLQEQTPLSGFVTEKQTFAHQQH